MAELQTACRRALAAGAQQERLIEALLTLARSERGLDRREPLDLREITGTVVVETTTGQGQATVTVTNTGPVIPPEQLDRLFQPFTRHTGERTATRDGLGLGLPIVAAIATAHDGHLDARPLPTGGLAITISFPGTPLGIDMDLPSRAQLTGIDRTGGVREPTGVGADEHAGEQVAQPALDTSTTKATASSPFSSGWRP